MMGKSLFSCVAVCTALLLILGILNTSSATVISQRVVGGQNATRGTNQWMVSLMHNGAHTCGGSLISPNWIVTAAHCVIDKSIANFKARMGMLTLEDDTSSAVIRDVVKCTSHPLYKEAGDSGDIAVMRLKESVTYSNYIRAICLPEQGRDFSQRQKYMVTGWGYIKDRVPLGSPGVLQEAEVLMMNHTVCEKMYRDTFPTSYPGGKIRSDMVCAGNPDGTKDTCQGDSGGPLVSFVNDSWYMVGVVSWGVGCGTAGAPGVYTKMANFTNWIMENTDPNIQPCYTGTKVTTSTTSQPSKAVSTTVTTGKTLATSAPPKPACGQPIIKQRVVGGQNSTLGQSPWVVSLMYRGYHHCGACLISQRYVVTTAHCVANKSEAEMMVRMGIVNLEGNTSSEVMRRVMLVLINPLYTGVGSSGDVAVLKMNEEVPLSIYIIPICLPEQGHVVPDGQMCDLAGWGSTAEGVPLKSPKRMQKVSLPLINHTNCEAMYRNTFPSTYPGGLIHRDMLCAGYPDGKKDGCQGDGGGPLVCLVSKTSWTMVGVMSWGVGCAKAGAPAVFTKISDFSNWLINNTDLKGTQTYEREFNTGAKVTTFTTSQPSKSVSTTVKTLTTSEPPKTGNPTTIFINKVTTSKPKNAAQSFTLSNVSWNAAAAQDDATADCGHRSSSPMCLLAMGLILTRIWGIFQG